MRQRPVAGVLFVREGFLDAAGGLDGGFGMLCASDLMERVSS